MSMLNRILVPVAFSARCQDATRYAAALACRFHSELILLHVYLPPLATYASPEGYATPPRFEIEETMARIHQELDGFLAKELCGIKVRRELWEGDPAQTIVEFARAQGCELIVMPTHGYGPFRRFLLGSVTAKVLHDACCPIFTGPHLEHPPALESPSFAKVLCAIDLGPQTRAVLQWGSWFADQFGSAISVVHALPSAITHLDVVYFDPQWRNDLMQNARCRFDAIRKEIDFPGEIHVEAGDVPDVVGRTAEAAGADVVVIGRGHRQGLLGRLRANAYGIVRESPCPVVTI